jgi:hypothetical protein
MKAEGKFILLSIDELKTWLSKIVVARKILLIQNHHTAIPGYKDFNGSNHFTLVKNMESYHVKSAGMAEIAQNFTTYPDGSIMICRSLGTSPAGIYGANTNGICIEHVGNFDRNNDSLTLSHRKVIIQLNAELCRKFSLVPNTDTIVYHHWYDLKTGKRTNGEGQVKTCPGTAFFGGNTVEAATENFIPLIKEAI